MTTTRVWCSFFDLIELICEHESKLVKGVIFGAVGFYDDHANK